MYNINLLSFDPPLPTGQSQYLPASDFNLRHTYSSDTSRAPSDDAAPAPAPELYCIDCRQHQVPGRSLNNFLLLAYLSTF